MADVRLIKDIVSGAGPSFAHIQLMNRTRIEEAIRALNGQSLQGRTIRVAELGAQPIFKPAASEMLVMRGVEANVR